MKQSGTGGMKKNVLISMGAQALTLLVSLIAGMVVPKFIDEYQYAYWQSYVLYVSYVGVLHFGLLDGLLLRYGAYDYEQLDKPRLRSQLAAMLCVTGFFAIAAAAAVLLAAEGPGRHIFLLVAVGIVTKNIFTYASYTYQITNRINQYAAFIVVGRLFFGAALVTLLLLKTDRFEAFAAADLLADVFALLVFLPGNRKLFFGKLLPLRECLRECRENIADGILLMAANLSYSLLFGGARMVTDWRFHELVFGKVSFAFSVSNLFLSFVTAVGVVLFPAIKRMDRAELPGMYGKVRSGLSAVLAGCMILYFPGCRILELWLPNYRESLLYLGLLLPSMLFTSKVTMLTNNYFKAYMQQKKMFQVNLISLGAGLALFLLSAYGFGSVKLLLLCTTLSIMLRSVWSEMEVAKILHLSLKRSIAEELLVSAVFMACAVFLPLHIGCAVYLLFAGRYILWVRRESRIRLVP